MVSLDELRSIYLFAGLGDEKLERLIAVGEEVHFEDGQLLFREADPADAWWMLLEGRIELTRRSGRERSVIGAMDRPGIWAGGFRAWTDAAGYLATGTGAGSGRVLRVPSTALAELAHAWFPFGVHLIEGFFRTVRNIEALARQRESVMALGTLAAGLAHEMNNPASAATRSVDALQETIAAQQSSLVRLAERSISAEQFIALDGLRDEIDPATAPTDLLALTEREESIAGWLDDHGVEASWRLAPALAAGGVDVAWCDRLAEVIPDDAREPALDWVTATVSTVSLLSEVKESTARISALVNSVRSYSQMDRASIQSIDVTDGIESTLVMLGHKLGDGVSVVRDYDAGASRIEAYPGELNQVWTNLIDNAIDAMDGQGALRISTTAADDGGVVVEVADSGAGMPSDVQAHAFDPFFTTKDVGKGTGLGLDISRRIIEERHGGEISVRSKPGETVFRIRLPSRPAAPHP
jgi:signal transduction histidine kinase